MIKNYLSEYKPKNSFLSYHNVSGIFRKIESFVFILLCIALIVNSKLDNKVNQEISIQIVQISVPIVSVVSAPFNLIVDLFANFQELVSAKKRNAVLVQENQKLKALYIESLNIYQESKRVKEVLKYAETRSSNFLVARLAASPYQIYSHNVFIDMGSDLGVEEGNIVTGNNTLIGRVSNVGKNKARVLLTTDINSRIPVIVSSAKVKGILAGNNSDIMEIMYLEKDHNIKVGDMVFSSGDGDSIPPGFLMGVVVDVDKRYAAVKAVESVKNLDVVSVIKY